MRRIISILVFTFLASFAWTQTKTQVKETAQEVQQKATDIAQEKIKRAKSKLAQKTKQAQDAHDHKGNHAGHNHGDHSGHDHSDHNHSDHKKSNHDHSGHNHSDHKHGSHFDHKGSDHKKEKAHQKKAQSKSAASSHKKDTHDSHGSHGDHDSHSSHKNNYTSDCGVPAKPHHHEGYDPSATAIHHISDANVYNIMDLVKIPLPSIIYNKARGLEFFSSGKFEAGHHDNGKYGYKDYVLYEGSIHRITCPDFKAEEKFEVEGFDMVTLKDEKGKEYDKRYAIVNGKAYILEQKTIWDGGVLGGQPSSFYDLSITKNVASMFLVCSFLFFLFKSAVKSYASSTSSAPSGIQSFVEPMFQFIRDDVAIPFLGDKHEKFLPLLMTIFFFILGLNLWGQVPFLGNVNVTGSLTVTAVMAILVFIITSVNGNKDYWKHIFNMPGVPWYVKIILTPVELLGMFIKPITLMLRLAGNITAGHIAILSFVGLIFIFGKAGTNMAGSLTGTALAVPLTLFMMAIELIVAFVQAYVFTILTASYLGAATEDHDHH